MVNNNFCNIVNNNNNNNNMGAEQEGNNNLREYILGSIFSQSFATREELITDLNLEHLQQLKNATSSFFNSEPKPTLGERIAVVKIFLKLPPTEREELGGLVFNYLGANTCIQTVIIALNEIRLVNNQSARQAIIQKANTNEVDMIKKYEVLKNAKNDYIKSLTQIWIEEEDVSNGCAMSNFQKKLELISEPNKIISHITSGKAFFLKDLFVVKRKVRCPNRINLDL